MRILGPWLLVPALTLVAMEAGAAVAGSPASTHTVRRLLRPAVKPLGRDSVLVLIGDLPPPGPGGWVRTLEARIEVAAAAGADTVVLVCDTRQVEGTFATLDALLRRALERGLGVLPRIVVDSATFVERVEVTQPFPEQLPAFTNPGQLAAALELLTTVIAHLEAFPNVVAYQIEWGHFGESWINAPYWASPSSDAAFLDFLHTLSPEFGGFSPANLASWPFGVVMAGGDCWPAGDPRRDPLRVAEFHWYQRWRDATSRAITWALRERARSLTARPVAGFSYVVAGPAGTLGYAYTAAQHLDVALSDWPPTPATAHDAFIRDAAFTGLHLAELDFDTPYVALDRAAEAVAAMAARGITPVIFYPHFSSALHDADIPQLVALVKAHPPVAVPPPAEVLVVLGNQAVGINGLSDTSVLPEGGGPVTGDNPAGVLPLLLGWGLSVDAASPDVYAAALGNAYRAVVVASPVDEPDSTLQAAVAATAVPVLIVHPSFLVGLPTVADPTRVTSAYCAGSNPVRLAGREIRVRVWGPEVAAGPAPDIHFLGPLSQLGTIRGYTPNRRVFSFFEGDFDQVMAVADFAGTRYPVIARLGTTYLFGLVTNVADPIDRAACQRALAGVLSAMGIETTSSSIRRPATRSSATSPARRPSATAARRVTTRPPRE